MATLFSLPMGRELISTEIRKPPARILVTTNSRLSGQISFPASTIAALVPNSGILLRLEHSEHSIYAVLFQKQAKTVMGKISNIYIRN